MLVAVAAAETQTITTAATENLSQNRFGFGGGSWSPVGGGFLKTGSLIPRSSVLSPERAQKGVERLPVGVQRRHGDPLLGTVVAGTDGPELDRRHAHPQERDRVRGSVAADAHRLPLVVLRGGLAQGAEENRVAVDDRRRAREQGPHLDLGVDPTDLLQDHLRILFGEVADVDVYRTPVGDLVE